MEEEEEEVVNGDCGAWAPAVFGPADAASIDSGSLNVTLAGDGDSRGGVNVG